MEGRIKGSYPGGPRRDGSVDKLGRQPRLSSVGEIEERRARRSLTRTRTQRSKRVIVGFILSVLVSGGIGWALGLQSHRTPERLVAEKQRPRGVLDAMLSQQVNRTLLELWRMEDVEYLRSKPRPR